MQALWRDVRYSLRGLRKAPAFTIVVVVTLGLGIGANAAIFSLLDQVLLRSLPVQDPAALVLLDGPGPFRGRTMNDKTFSYPMYTDFRDRNEGFSGMLARFPLTVTVSWQGTAERAHGDLVSGNYFDVLGVRPYLGRLFTDADDRVPGSHPIAVLSHGYWVRRFGADPRILGQTVLVNGHALTVVGVSAPRFGGLEVGSATDVMVPLMMKSQMTPTWNDLDNRRSRWLNVIGRLKPGVSADQARSQLDVVYRQINEQEIKDIVGGAQSFRDRFVAKRLQFLPGGRGLSDLRQQFSTPLVALMCMVGVVLLIACANVANLMLARTASRRKEVVVRLALGAGRGAIVRQRLVEAAILASGGALLGLVVSAWTGSLLLSVLPGESVTRSLSAMPDGRVLMFTLAVTVVTALLFGAGPALQATRAPVTASLREEGTSVAGGGRQARVRRALVVAQVALSMVLLAGAGLFARSLYNLTAVNPGFEVDHLVTFAVDPSLNGYSTDRSRALMKQLQEELASVPGVRSVSMAELGPLTGNDWSMTVKVDGYQAREDEDLNPSVDGVAPRFFETMGIPLVQGRDFTERDAAAAPKVAVINETMAKYFFGGANPVGHRFGFGTGQATDIEIVGVVRDARNAALRDEPRRFLYIPYEQDDSLTQLTYYVRAAGDPAGVAEAIRARVRKVDTNLPVADLQTMEAQVEESVFVDRLVAMLSVAFGLLATVLAAVGLFGVMNYAVARRTREIGIRMALGAERGRVLRMVLGEVAVLALTGVGLGLGLTFWASRRIASQLFGLSAHDPMTLGLATIGLVTVALLAGLVPARRATAIDPLTALRTD